MERLQTSNLRNVAFLSHGGVGKTTLVENLLFISNTIDRRGTTEAGNTTCDWEAEEIKRKISISLSVAPIFWQDKKINLIDSPGYADFMGEIITSLWVADSCILLVSGVAGVEVGTEKVGELLDEYNTPRIIFVNRLDKENSSFDRTLQDINSKFSKNLVVVGFPVGEESGLRGVVDIIGMKFLHYEDATGVKWTTKEIPEDLKDKALTYREKLMEAAAEGDDELLSKYLEGEKLTDNEVISGLRLAVVKNIVVPVLGGSNIIGAHLLLDLITTLLPSPTEGKLRKYVELKTKEELERKPNITSNLSLQIFKTILDPYVGKLSLFMVLSGIMKPDTQLYNSSKERIEKIHQVYLIRGKQQVPEKEIIAGDIGVISKLTYASTGDTLCEKDSPVEYSKIPYPLPVYFMAIEPRSRGDEEKMSTSLSRLMEEDRTFKMERSYEVKQTIISGLGDVHLEVMMEKLQRKFGVEIVTVPLRIPYKETITCGASSQGKYKRQSGGRGQYGDTWIKLEPRGRGEGFEFVDKIVGGVIPRNYIPSVEKGIRDTMQEGPLADYPVVDVKATLYDGSYHTVDSSDMAFQIAASMGFKKAAQEAGLVLLEPIYNISILIPPDYIGDIIGDLNGKRGRVQGTENRGNYSVISAQVPYSEMLRYSIDLRSQTQGKGSFTMEYSHYEEVPSYLAEKIIAQSKKNKEEEKEK